MGRDLFTFYRSYHEAIEKLSSFQALELYRALAEFCLNGKIPTSPDLALALHTILEQSGHLEEYQ